MKTSKNKALIFAGRNIKEMARDPVIYVFCVAFPVAMLILFVVINSFTNGTTPIFEFPSLLPGVITFSFSFIMLAECLLVSKDKTTSLLKRLYTSPMKKSDFVSGYFFRGNRRDNSDAHMHFHGLYPLAYRRLGLPRFPKMSVTRLRTVAVAFNKYFFGNSDRLLAERKIGARNNFGFHFRFGNTRRSLDAARRDGRI